jgi:nanoRNase/pAp phosphatase (c-di-AMP/oligoRNAs hydrolase)
VFAEKYFSELGNKLSELHPELDYIAMVDISYGGVSYRTVKDDIDLGGEIAHSFGGGGHRKAAGSNFDSNAVKDAVLHYIFDINEIIA